MGALPKRVLIVDDDRAITSAVAEVLSDAGYHVATAGDGAAAMGLLERERPTVVIVDLMMPVMDGWELIVRMKAHPQHSKIPVIVISAGGPRLLASAPVSRGYLEKPLSIDRLLQALSRIESSDPLAA